MNKMRKLLLAGGLLLSFYVNGINDYSPYGSARSISLSNATVATYGFLNPASTILMENSFLSATYENKYITKELSSTTFATLYKSKFADLSFCLNYFGYEVFNETSLMISSCKQLFDWMTLGVRVEYRSFYFHSESGRSNQMSAGIGLILFQQKKVNLGINLGNLLNVRTDKNYDPLALSMPFHFELGLAYHAMDDFCLLFQISKWKHQNLQLAVGAEYKGISSFPIRLGLSGMPFSPSFGIGYECKHFQIDVATNYYMNLGFSPSLTFLYQF